MKILQIHNKYKIPGGEDVVLKMEAKLLTSHGHEVKQWIEESKSLDNLSLFRKIISGFQFIWSVSAYKKTLKLISEFKPDVVHIHNVIPLITPSVYFACKSAKVPVIQSLHNFRYFCSSGLFYRKSTVCEECLNKKFPLNGILEKCYRGGYTQSLLMALYIWAHKNLNTYNKYISGFIALTEFSRKKYIEGGLDAQKIYVKPNFVDSAFERGRHNGGYVLFVGRLEVEKGLFTLIKAWNILTISKKLFIVGDGKLKAFIKSQKNSNIMYLGSKSSEEVRRLMMDAELLVVPSEWYEGFPMVIAEALSTGLPILGTKMGNVENIMNQGKFGLMFNSGDYQDLAVKIEQYFNKKKELEYLPESIITEAESLYSREINYQRMIEIYNKVKTG